MRRPLTMSLKCCRSAEALTAEELKRAYSDPVQPHTSRKTTSAAIAMPAARWKFSQFGAARKPVQAHTPTQRTRLQWKTRTPQSHTRTVRSPSSTVCLKSVADTLPPLVRFVTAFYPNGAVEFLSAFFRGMRKRGQLTNEVRQTKEEVYMPDLPLRGGQSRDASAY